MRKEKEKESVFFLFLFSLTFKNILKEVDTEQRVSTGILGSALRAPLGALLPTIPAGYGVDTGGYGWDTSSEVFRWGGRGGSLLPPPGLCSSPS